MTQEIKAGEGRGDSRGGSRGYFEEPEGLASQGIQGPQSRKNCEGRALGGSSPACLGAVEAPCSGEEVCSPSDSTARPESLELIPGRYALVFKKNKPLSPLASWHRPVRQASHLVACRRGCVLLPAPLLPIQCPSTALGSLGKHAR